MKKGTILVGMAVLLTTTIGTSIDSLSVKAARTGVDWSLNNGPGGAYLGYGSVNDAFMVSQVGGVTGWNSNGTPRIYEQSSYRPQVTSALSQGKAAHTYIWFQVGGDTRLGNLAMQHFLSEIATPKGSIVAIDYEAGASANVSANTAAVISAMEMVKAAGYTPVLYSGVDYFKNHLDVNTIVQQFGFTLWDADYPLKGAVHEPPMWYLTGENSPYPGYQLPYIPGLAIWQFTATYGGHSLDGNTDLTGITNNGYTQNAIANYNSAKLNGSALATGYINIRQYTNTYAKIVGNLRTNQSVNITAQITNGQPVDGNSTWYQIDNNGWVAGALLTNVNVNVANSIIIPQAVKVTLMNAINDASEYTASYYTKESFNNLQTALQNGRNIQGTTNATEQQYQQATQQLQNAMNNIVRLPINIDPSVRGGLANAISNASQYTGSYYTKESFNNLQTALQNARNTQGYWPSTQTQYQQATQQLQNAMNNIVRLPINIDPSVRSGLANAISDASEYTERYYTAASFANLQTALQNARNTRGYWPSTQAQYQQATQQLQNAMNNIVRLPNNIAPSVRSGLANAISDASEYTERYYTAGAFANLQAALRQARNTQGYWPSTQAQYQQATQQLQNAMNNIVRLPINIDPSVRSGLANAISDASEYTERYYTAASFANLQTALQNARNTRGYWPSTQAQYQQATQQLQNAMNNIVRLPNNVDPSVRSGLVNAISDASEYTERYYTAGSFANLQAALRQARNTQGYWPSTQAQYQQATQQLQNAMNNIVRLPNNIAPSVRNGLANAISDASEYTERYYTAGSFAN
ncbi:hypothetical protein, partial [Periweissella fabaria]